MTLNYHRFENPPFGEVTYVIDDGESCLLIDPGGAQEEIRALVEEKGWHVQAILLTHAHCDHVAGVMPLAERFAAPIYLHPDDRKILEYSNVYWQFIAAGKPFHGPKWADVNALPEGDFSVGRFDVEIIRSPGHTPGSCILRLGHLVVTGDTFFERSIGRTDLVGGDAAQLSRTIASLPDFSEHSLFLPGHGMPFTHGDLLRSNDQFAELRAK